MSIMRTMIVAVSFLLLGAAFAQEQKGASGAKGKEMTMTGCLNKGADVPQHLLFTDQKTGRKHTVTGPADLDKHAANHTVRITGSRTGKVFNVTSFEHVAATCEAKGGTGDAGAKKGSKKQ